MLLGSIWDRVLDGYRAQICKCRRVHQGWLTGRSIFGGCGTLSSRSGPKCLNEGARRISSHLLGKIQKQLARAMQMTTSSLHGSLPTFLAHVHILRGAQLRGLFDVRNGRMLRIAVGDAP